ncbi:MAG: peptidyl-prolyl cis-trans isomerase [Gammaproteobacteria bacterium]|nr:peptidyl-prolyl cis-trans isomerase [Gammaproteobacteria bacterium]
MSKIFREPLVHFIALGVLAFAVFQWRHPAVEVESDTRSIHIGSATVQSVVANATMNDPAATLTEAEISALLQPVIDDEILLREALRLQMDAGDEEVRKRLIAKMRFLLEDTVESPAPDERDIRNFYEANRNRFLRPAQISFEQIFFEPDNVTGAQQAFNLLQEDPAADVVAESDTFGRKFERADEDRLIVLFGAAFVQDLLAGPRDEWREPVRSALGWHVTRLFEVSPATMPAFEDIRSVVIDSYVAERRKRDNEEAYRRLRERYRVTIEYPQAPQVTPE